MEKAGIQSSKDLIVTIQSDGFNPRQLAALSSPNSGHHHHRNGGDNAVQSSTQTQGINTTALQNLQSILNQYDLNNLSQDQESQLMNQLNQSGLLQSGNVINLGA